MCGVSEVVDTVCLLASRALRESSHSHALDMCVERLPCWSCRVAQERLIEIAVGRGRSSGRGRAAIAFSAGLQPPRAGGAACCARTLLSIGHEAVHARIFVATFGGTGTESQCEDSSGKKCVRRNHASGTLREDLQWCLRRCARGPVLESGLRANRVSGASWLLRVACRTCVRDAL
jgi:hypothetical protein